jgi:DNA-3-methyladenine glycosylase
VTAGLPFHDPVETARALIGWTLTVDGVGGPVVEAEAYDEGDPASHSYGGLRLRNAAMFGPAGTYYVYRSHGIHWCLNLVCREEGAGAAVLIRALEPVHGVEAMRRRRGRSSLTELASGPGRVGQALAVSLELTGRAAELQPPPAPRRVVATPRIGISRAVDHPWRFVDADSPHLSRRLSSAARERHRRADT